MSLTFKKNKKRDIPFVSSSILNSFVGCKYRYWHEFIKNDGYNHYREDTDDESIYLTFGTIVHGSIENFWKVKRTKKNLINEYEKLFGDQFPTYPLMLARTEEQVIETINDCIENGKDVYQMGYLEDSLDILY